MIEISKLPKELIAGTGKPRYVFGQLQEPFASRRILKGIDEMQYLFVRNRTRIKKHGHNNQWEVWVWLSKKTAYVCLIGEEHELVNDSDEFMELMAIKGHTDYSFDDLSTFLCNLGFLVRHGSLEIHKNS